MSLVAFQDISCRAEPKARRRGLLAGAMGRIVKVAVIAAGSVLMVGGVLIAPLPGPFGLPISAVGLMLILKNSYWAKRQFIRVQYARPGWVYPVRRLMRPKPEFAPVTWQSMLRMERLLLRRGQDRVLKRFRHSLKRRR